MRYSSVFSSAAKLLELSIVKVHSRLSTSSLASVKIWAEISPPVMACFLEQLGVLLLQCVVMIDSCCSTTSRLAKDIMDSLLFLILSDLLKPLALGFFDAGTTDDAGFFEAMVIFLEMVLSV